MIGRRVGRCQRHAQDGVGTKVLLVLGTVELDHAGIDRCLVECVVTDQFRSELLVDIGHRTDDALAQEGTLVTVAQFPGFVDTSAGTAGHGRAAERTVGELDINLDRRVATAIENLTGMDISNRGTHLLAPTFFVYRSGTSVGPDSDA